MHGQPRPMHRGPLRLAAVVLLAATAAVAVAASSSSAATLCVGTSELAISPPLTNTPTVTRMSTRTTFATCRSTSDPTLTGGGAGSTLPEVERQCTDLLQSRRGTRVYRWNNGQTSTFSYTDTFAWVLGNLVVTQTGTIVAGEFTGSSVLATVTLVPDPLLGCAPLGAGVSSMSGLHTVTIT